MGTFRIVISDIRGIEPSLLAENVLAAHGDSFDAARGDFTVTAEGDTVTVIAKDVAGGDIDGLADDIRENEDGTFTLRMAQQEGSNWYPRDEGDDDL